MKQIRIWHIVAIVALVLLMTAESTNADSNDPECEQDCGDWGICIDDGDDDDDDDYGECECTVNWYSGDACDKYALDGDGVKIAFQVIGATAALPVIAMSAYLLAKQWQASTLAWNVATMSPMMLMFGQLLALVYWSMDPFSVWGWMPQWAQALTGTPPFYFLRLGEVLWAFFWAHLVSVFGQKQSSLVVARNASSLKVMIKSMIGPLIGLCSALLVLVGIDIVVSIVRIETFAGVYVIFVLALYAVQAYILLSSGIRLIIILRALPSASGVLPLRKVITILLLGTVLVALHVAVAITYIVIDDPSAVLFFLTYAGFRWVDAIYQIWLLYLLVVQRSSAAKRPHMVAQGTMATGGSTALETRGHSSQMPSFQSTSFSSASSTSSTL